MENCLICLKSNEDILSRITTTSVEWIENKMQKIIEKHLWWWYLNADPKNKLAAWICRQCWQAISDFHNFYKKVEKAHRLFQPIPSLLNQIAMEEIQIKVEESDQVLEANADISIIKVDREESFWEHNSCMENLITIDEVKVESSYEFLSDDSVNVETSGENPLISALKLGDVEKNQSSLIDGSINTEISIDEVKVESPNEFLSDDSVNALKLEDVENSQCDRNETDILDNTPVKRIKMQTRTIKQDSDVKRSKKKETVHNKSAKNENLKYKINQVDEFFKENRHSLECSICNVGLSDFRSIKAHYRNEHNTRGYALCCGKKYFKRWLLVDHLRVHEDPNYFRCELCTKTFETRRGFEMHMQIHQVRERKYNCDECGKSYLTLNTYKLHKLTHVPDIERCYKCSQCDKKFASDDLRRRHENKTHAKKNAKVCDICGKSFCSAYLFVRHMEEHAGIPQPMVTCDICGVQLTNKYGLRQHKRMRHVEENLQEQKCPHCSKVSPTLYAHRNHIKYSHTMQRKHACHLCEKAFKLPLGLKEHLSTHTGEALYTCPYCPRTFISNANMYKHKKISHRLEWEETRSNKMKKSHDRIKTISPNIGKDKEVVQTLPITGPFINSFPKCLENAHN